MVPSNHTVAVYVAKGWRGKPLITMGLFNLFFSSFLRGIDPNSGSGGNTVINMGFVKLFSSSFFR